MKNFPTSYPYFNKYGLLLRRRDMERIAGEILETGKLHELGVETAEALLETLPNAKTFQDIIATTLKLVRYRRRRGWYEEPAKAIYQELDPRMAAAIDYEEAYIQPIILESIRQGLTSAEILGKLDLKKVERFLKEG